MTPDVCILATCRNPALARATTLVFDTLMVGFPSAEVTVYLNGAMRGCEGEVRHAAEKAGLKVQPLLPTTHHEWIEMLVRYKHSPFWICDTDVCFWDSMEQWDFKGHALAGRFIPPFWDDFTNCVTRGRLHTSLLYIDPDEVRSRLDVFRKGFPQTPFNPLANLFYPVHIPPHEFYDTCALLYRTIAGWHFTPEQNDCYDHLHAGTISDLVAPHLNDGGMGARHSAMMAKPELMRGIWRLQDEYFQAKAVEVVAA